MKQKTAKNGYFLIATAIIIIVCTGCPPKHQDETLLTGAPAQIAPHATENGVSLPKEDELSDPAIEIMPDSVPDEQNAPPAQPAQPDDSADAPIVQQAPDAQETPAPADPPEQAQVLPPTAVSSSPPTESDPSAEAPIEQNGAKEAPTDSAVDDIQAFTFTLVGQRIYDAYEELLRTYVDKDGNVDYATLRRKRGDLYAIIRDLDELDPREYLPWDRDQKIAFWLNAYNIFTLKVVIDHYPIEPTWTRVMLNYPRNSIMHIRDAWTKKYFKVAGVEWTLREIEREKLVKEYGDLRVCLALSYASMGGAILRNEPYYPDRLDEQLDDQARKFLSDPRGFEISGRTVYLADIFNWYRQDFIGKYGEIRRFREKPPQIQAYLNFIANYVRPADLRYLETQDYTVEFRKYDWRLNEQSQK